MTNEKTPIAKKIDYEFEIHGQKIKDEYSWMRAKDWPNKVEDKKILSYLEEENNYFNKFFSNLDEQKESIFQELKSRIKLADQSTYTKRDDYYYYTRTEEKLDYPIYCRKHGSTTAKEEILLDVNEIAKGKSFTNIGAFSVSPDNKLIAYSVDFTGGEKYTIKLFDLEKNTYLKDEIIDTIGPIVWHESNKGFFYTPTNENWRHDTVKFHELGESIKNDRTILHEPDPLYSVSVSKSSSKEYIFINVGGHDSNAIHYIKMNDSEFTPVLLHQRKDKITCSIDHGGKYFYKHSNEEAINFKIERIESNKFESINSNWEEYIRENKDKYLSSFDITKNYFIINYKVVGLPEIIVRNLSNKVEKTLSFPDASYTAGGYSTNFKEDDIRVNYSSLSRPSTVYQYDFSTEKLDILKVQEIPSGLNSEEYKVERVMVPTDGVMVPVSLFYKKSLFKKDGSNPLYLYGYGSYGISVPPSFRNSAISLVNRGFVYAIAHIRGGSDLGYKWYEDAKFLTKKRTFNDFLAAANYLAEQKYTSKGNIAIMGGSAGGMLIGNVINQQPELFKAAIAHVPFVDVLNTMLDETLPLTPGEFKEWGNPKDKEYFEYMKTYSPYDNIKTQKYPNIMVTAGLSDPRVGYWEAAKWVARLRDQKTDDNLIIYKTNMEFGHQGASGRFDYLKEAAEDLVFLFNIFKKNIK